MIKVKKLELINIHLQNFNFSKLKYIYIVYSYTCQLLGILLVSHYKVGGVIFNGYFSVDNTSNVIQSFYNAIDITFSNNIIITTVATFTNTTGSHNDTQSNNLFVSNIFPVGGTTISSIPNLDATYNATEWALWNGSATRARLSYYSNGLWTDLPNTFINIFNINPISDPSCFNEGTKILCLNKNLEEEYIPIENLRKGDLVKSYKHGYRKIDLIGKNPMINNPNRFNECMYKMEKTEENGLLDDLIVTGGHSVLVDDLGEYKEENDKLLGSTQIIDDKYLLLSSVSKDFIKIDTIHLYTYYHFILENNGNDDERFGVWANGLLTETPPKSNFFKVNLLIIN